MSDLIFNGDSLRGIVNDAEDIKYDIFDYFYSDFSKAGEEGRVLNWSTMTEAERKELAHWSLEHNRELNNVNNVKDALDTLFNQVSSAFDYIFELEDIVYGLSSKTKILTQTLDVNMTSVTFTNVPVDKNYIMDFFTSIPMDYEEIDASLYQSQQKISVIFPENTTGAAVQVYCKLEAIS